MMKKGLAVFLAAMLCSLFFACAYAEPADAYASAAMWYELSGEDTVLTVRLPGNNQDGMDWEFEISNPEALELLAYEEIEDESEGMEDSATTSVASFISTACAENKVSLIMRYGTGDPDEPAFAARVLELNVSADNVISVASVLERSRSADWIHYDTDNCMLTVTLSAAENGSQAWDTVILNPEFSELITCETENGYVGSFRSNLASAGCTELQISHGNTRYTINLFAGEGGDLFVEWTEVFTVLTAEANAE